MRGNPGIWANSTFLLTCAVWTLPLFASVRHASDLGWSPGQDVTSKLDALLGSGILGPGDELVLDHTYRISGTHQLPDDFTLSAIQGAGFDVTDAHTNKDLLRLGHRTTLRNLTLTYLNTPALGPKGTNPVRHEDFTNRIGIYASGKSDVRIENCRMIGSINHHIKLSGCRRPRVISSHIQGGFWTVYLVGDVTDPVFRNCVIEQCQGDAIKTGMGGDGTQRALVESCVFQDNGRDGIDTTGGFKDSTVRNSLFRRLFSGMDIKSLYEQPSHVASGMRNTGIDVQNCRFTDMNTAISLSTLDRGLAYNGHYFLNASNCHEYAPHDIDLDDCVVERTGTTNGRMLLLKGGHTVRYQNARFLSNPGVTVDIVSYSNVYEVFGPKSLSKPVSDALNYGVTGWLGPSGLPGAPGDTSVPFSYGPVPEPTPLVLLGLGALGVLRRRWR